MALNVLRPGLCSVQAGTRSGFEAQGISPGGAADQPNAQLANALVGNPLDAATLEIRLLGPRLCFEHDALIALTGARVDARLADLPCPLGRPVTVRAGQQLSIERFGRGSTLYLACAGGINVPVRLGSRSTDLLAGFGGHQGRYLQVGDRLQFLPPNALQTALLGAPAPAWWCELTLPASLSCLRMIASELHCEALYQTRWRVSARSTRIGVVLDGAPLQLQIPEQISAGVVPGVVQLLRSGLPVVLGADAQTIGGYPVLGCVVSADLASLAQLRPGESVTLAPIALSAAQFLSSQANCVFERMLCHLKERLDELAYGKNP